MGKNEEDPSSRKIDTDWLYCQPHQRVRLHVERFDLNGTSIFLLAKGNRTPPSRHQSNPLSHRPSSPLNHQKPGTGQRSRRKVVCPACRPPWA
jgi:hypothetical protein